MASDGCSDEEREQQERQLLRKLSSNWRRVASTHSLEELAQADVAKQPPATVRHLVLGVLLLLGAALALTVGAFALVVSKLLPPLQHPVLAAIQQDEYYCLLVISTIPVAIASVSLNWFSLKIFKHNS